mgnify:CR=1 FL=1
MIAIVDKVYYDVIKERLKAYNITAYPSYESKILPAPVNTHPDMSCFVYDTKSMITSYESYEYYESIFKGSGISLINSYENPETKYPYDVKFNALRVSDYLISKESVSAAAIKERFSKDKLINSSQGYVKCSVIDIAGKYFISDDIYLEKIISALGYKTLLVDKGLVKIDGYDYGFIGGASGYAENKIFLSGRIKDEKNRKRIEEFVLSINKELIYLTEYDIFDVGTLMIMED